MGLKCLYLALLLLGRWTVLCYITCLSNRSTVSMVSFTVAMTLAVIDFSVSFLTASLLHNEMAEMLGPSPSLWDGLFFRVKDALPLVYAVRLKLPLDLCFCAKSMPESLEQATSELATLLSQFSQIRDKLNFFIQFSHFKETITQKCKFGQHLNTFDSLFSIRNTFWPFCLALYIIHFVSQKKVIQVLELHEVNSWVNLFNMMSHCTN